MTQLVNTNSNSKQLVCTNQEQKILDRVTVVCYNRVARKEGITRTEARCPAHKSARAQTTAQEYYTTQHSVIVVDDLSQAPQAPSYNNSITHSTTVVNTFLLKGLHTYITTQIQQLVNTNSKGSSACEINNLRKGIDIVLLVCYTISVKRGKENVKDTANYTAYSSAWHSR